MLDAIWNFLSTEGFQPHGMCLLWRADVFWAHAVSDIVIAGAYFSIPAALIYFAIKRSDLVYRWVLHLFGAFIIACGLTHVFGLWTLWVPDYGLEAIIKVATAAISATVAIMLWPLMPKLLAIPSAQQLEEKNALLAEEVTERQTAEAELQSLNRELEARVAERTDSLERMNWELRLSRAAAEQSNKAKSDFLAVMSHEVRTPLHGVLATAGLLRHTDLDERQMRYAETIERSGAALLEIVNNILDLSRIEAGAIEIKREPFDLRALLEGVQLLWESRVNEKRLEYINQPSPDLPVTAVGDADRIREILNNLVNNALKFTDEGHIAVKAGLETPTTSADGGDMLLRFEVSDTGPGIDPAQQERLFERFEQGDASLTREHGGSGLGLAICRDLCKLLGGKIGVRGEPGKGSTFWFTVACGAADSTAAVATGQPDAAVGVPPFVPNAAETGPLDILVAEDNRINQVLIRDILEQHGHNVHIVANGVDAVNAARESRYDLIFMDVQMPVMDGLEAARMIRERQNDVRVPIVALTAHAMRGDRDLCFAAGMDDYISKPFSIDQIHDLVARYARVA